MFSLNSGILLWSVGARSLMNDAMGLEKFSESSVKKLSTIVTPDGFNGCAKVIFDVSMK